MKEMIHDYCVKNDIDGISVCIHLKGEEVFSYQEGFKNEQKEWVDRHTRFTIGSISKLFITVGILQLEEKGLLSLKDPVYSYLPDFKMDDPRYKDITIEMLLNHSSGLPSVSFKKKYTNHFEPSYIQDILKMYQILPLKSDPGKYSVYCNDGFVLAQYLLETLTKQSFRDYCLEHITLPCKMMDTEFPGAILDEKSYAHAFNAYDHSFNQEFVNGIGSGGVYSTAKDLCLFYDTFYNGKLLSQTSIDKMKELHAKSYLQLESNTNGYGLGFDYVEVPYFKAYGKTALAKGGATFGYMSYGYVILEDQLSVCIVATSKEAGVALLAKELGARFLNTKPKTLYLDKVMSQVDAIDGIYGAGNRVYQIQKQENQLKLSVLKGTKFKEVALLQQKADEFVSQDIILGFKQPHFGFVFEQGKCFMYVNYFDGYCEVRSILACRIDFKKDVDFTLNEGWYLKTNEYLDQRTFYTQDLEIAERHLIVDTKEDTTADYEQQFLKDMEDKFIEVNENGEDVLQSYRINMRGTTVEEQNSMTAMIASICLYIAFVLISAVGTILAVQSLSDSTKYKYRYSTLRRIGVNDKSLFRTIKKQLLILFGVPTVYSIICGFFMVVSMNNIFQILLQSKYSYLAYFIGSLLIFFFIYGIYWIATYIGFKRNINEES